MSETYVETVSHLSEVGGSLDIEVEGFVQFLVSRQGVHDNGGRLRLGHDIVVDNIEILDGVVLGRVVESLPRKRTRRLAQTRNREVTALTFALGSYRGHRSC